jgi:hypothetical protein
VNAIDREVGLTTLRKMFLHGDESCSNVVVRNTSPIAF